MRFAKLLSSAAAVIVTAGVFVGSVRLDEGAPASVDRTELDFHRGANAYEAIYALRQGWLGLDKPKRETPSVFIEMRCSELTCLHWLQTDQVEAIHFMDSQSNSELGPPRRAGPTIVVTLRMRSMEPNPGAGSR